MPNEFAEMPRKPVAFVKITEGNTRELREDLNKVAEKHGIIFVMFDQRFELLERDDVVKILKETVGRLEHT